MTADARAWLDSAQARAAAAGDEVTRLTSAPGGPAAAWRWSIPARPERDSDLLLSAPLPDLDAALAALRAVLDLADRMATSPWSHEHGEAVRDAITAALPGGTR